jgi:hypothetical protein
VALDDDPSGSSAVLALLAIFLPAMTYVFLATLYLFEQLQRRMHMR